MPEGDTVFRTAAVLREALVGKTLTRCDVRVPRFAAADLSGRRVDEVLSRGKHLFIRIGDASVHSHLKMDGSWQIARFGERCSSASKRPGDDRFARFGRVRAPAHKVRIVLAAGDVTASGVDLGILEILDRATDLDAVAHLGPDLPGPDWSAPQAAANLVAAPERPLAEALLDQRNLAGVGNVYANELCFVFGRLPTAPVHTLADPLRAVTRAQQMLWANRLRRNRTTTGDTHRGRELWVYGRAGQPCRRCGALVEGNRAGERISFWCPSCQR